MAGLPVRTPEQVAADEALTAAITRVFDAYGDDGHAYVMSEYLVIASHHRYADDGEPMSGVSIMFRDGDVPYHRALGLLTYARIQLGASIIEDDDESQ